MVLDLQLAFSILLAGLVLLCVFVAKLREMAEAGGAAHQGPILRPLKDEADVVLPGSRDQHECKRRVRFEDDARRCDGLKGFSGKAGLSEESTEEGAANSSCPREIMIEKQSEETEVKGRTEEPRNCRGWSDDQEQEYDSDDDWEGIEKTELERAFDQAVLFFESLKISGLGSGIGNDEKMMLYGLHKIATEGPCHEPQPLPFKVSARAKWNAWQQLGTMSPEDAMKQYIDLVSAISPKGMQNDITGR